MLFLVPETMDSFWLLSLNVICVFFLNRKGSKDAKKNKTVICAQKCKRQRLAQAVIRTWNALFTLWHAKSFPARLKKLSPLSAVFSRH